MNIAIVEDQIKDADLLASYIEKYSQGNGLPIYTERYPDGLDFLSNYKHQYDAVFMDIQMPFVDGMSVATKLRALDENVILVFVTNMTQYAVQGYELNACDFLVKPLAYNVFSHKFKRIIYCAQKNKKAEILINTKTEKRRINATDIDFIEVTGHKCLYHIGDKTIESWDSLANIYNILSQIDFCYCNACYLVNLNRVEAIEKDFAIVHGHRLKISRPKKKEFLHKLSLSMGRIYNGYSD